MSRNDSEFEFAHDSASILPLNQKPLHRYVTKILLRWPYRLLKDRAKLIASLRYERGAASVKLFLCKTPGQ